MGDRWGAAFVRIGWQASFGLGGSFAPDWVAGITGIRIAGHGVVPYRVGTRVYLEDAPVFRASQKQFHRVCGPYEVQALGALPTGATIVYSHDGKPIVYLEPHPERGPWGNGTRVRRNVCGLDLKFRQTAKEFNYYPYRFSVRPAADWAEIVVPHRSDCELHD